MFSAVALVAFSFAGMAKEVEEIILDPSCDDAMFAAMDWAANAGFDDQTIANIGNWAYANCWLRQRSELNPSF